MAMTIWSLVRQIGAALTGPLGLDAGTMNGVTALLLLLLAIYLVVEAARAARRTTAGSVAIAV